MAFVIKNNGEQELFQSEKLRTSLRGAGADEKVVGSILAHIDAEVVDGMTTTEIYSHAFDLLKRHGEQPAAARYSLKRAVMDLGPSGFPFEKLVASIFETKGHDTKTNVLMQGACVRHEVDFIAQRNDSLIVGEAKFHNTPGFKTDLKVVLYVDARFRDLQNSDFDGRCRAGMQCQSWLITNTKFTRNAISYAQCGSKMKLIGWDHPKNHNLRDLIESSGVHPVTCLTTLSKGDKKKLFDLGHVLCRSITSDTEVLRHVGVTGQKASNVLKEARLLCNTQ